MAVLKENTLKLLLSSFKLYSIEKTFSIYENIQYNRPG